MLLINSQLILATRASKGHSTHMTKLSSVFSNVLLPCRSFEFNSPRFLRSSLLNVLLPTQFNRVLNKEVRVQFIFRHRHYQVTCNWSFSKVWMDIKLSQMNYKHKDEKLCWKISGSLINRNKTCVHESVKKEVSYNSKHEFWWTSKTIELEIIWVDH